MSALRIAARSWWKVALAAFAIALATVLPSTASAQSYYYPGNTGSYYGNNPYVNYGGYYGNTGYGQSNGGYQQTAANNYRGYAYISGAGGCPVNANCVWRGNVQPVYGFRWTGYGWQRYQLASGRYYVQPYSGKWRWVLTGHGYLIVGDAQVTVSY